MQERGPKSQSQRRASHKSDISPKKKQQALFQERAS